MSACLAARGYLIQNSAEVTRGSNHNNNNHYHHHNNNHHNNGENNQQVHYAMPRIASRRDTVRDNTQYANAPYPATTSILAKCTRYTLHHPVHHRSVVVPICQNRHLTWSFPNFLAFSAFFTASTASLLMLRIAT